jgi:hypothetical protein
MTELAEREGLKVKHWELLGDYIYDDPNIAYRCFAWMMRIGSALRLPERFIGNTMLFVLE